MATTHPLRPVTEMELQTLQRLAHATSERVDVARRAQALLLVREGRQYVVAAHQVGLKSGDSVSHLVERFNQHGLAALHIAAGRGRRPTYTPAERDLILQTVHRSPDRERDGTATWSLVTLQRALRRDALPHVSTWTIRLVLHDAGYHFGRTRTWCPTGTAQRVRKSGIVTVQDPKAGEKKS